jgi:peptide/nickel transport system substrate-binding protein
LPARPGSIFGGLCVALLALSAVAQPTPPKVLRWSASGDVVTLDPHAPPDTFSDGMLHNIYERLLTRDKDYRLAPSLAVSWTAVSPTRMRFQLRKGVVFHDGAPFTADDVVFSLKRMQRPLSSQRASLAGVIDVVRIDDFTVDVVTERPLPSLLPQLGTAPILCKAWLLKHGAAEPHDYTGGRESYSARHANGTGPYVVRSHDSGVKLVMAANPRWWGQREGNADEVVFRPISANGTRMAALLSGETDLLLDPPPQDIERVAANPQLKVVKGAEHRVVLLSFDALRDELLFSDVKGRNPFKDRRVREAMALAVDTEAIHQKVMRGLSLPTGTVIPQGVTGYSEKAARRTPPDLERARRLLLEAGYPQGFGVRLDCTNDRYVLDEQICVALAAMIGKIGIRVTAYLQPKALFFQRVDVVRRETSFYMVGVASPTGDAMLVLDSLLHTFGQNGLGENNVGRFSSARIDAVLDAARTELDPVRRDALMEEAQLLQKQEFFYIPIHQQVTPWAMRRNIDAVHRPDNYLDLRWVTVK